MKRLSGSLGFAFLLNFLLPGLAHIYWGEVFFGAFIFLIILLGTGFFLFSFLVSFPLWAKLALFGLPVVFYVCTFVDLAKTVKAKHGSAQRTLVVVMFCSVVAFAYQFLAPWTPLNFSWRNRPEMFRVRDNRFSPVLKKGDVAAINRLSYRMDLFFLDTPIWHDAPKRGDLIRYVDGTWTCRTGLILGLPGEDVEITGGILTVDSYPYVAALPLGLQLTGDVPLTFVDRSYILVATLNLGAVVGVYHVPVGSIIGKVHRLF